MMSKFDVILAIDPGIYGGLTIFDGKKQPQVHKIPLLKIIVNKKPKNIYNVVAIAKILRPYQGKKVLFIQEFVGAMKSNGGVSMFGFGKSAGLTLGVAAGLGFSLCEVRPQKWKKQFPELITQGIIDKKAEIKELRASLKKEVEKLELFGKTLKDKKLKKTNKEQIKTLEKENKKQTDKLSRQIKAEAKTNARNLAMKLYPKMADKFVKKNTDGLAESVLIALYGRKNQDELVQNS